MGGVRLRRGGAENLARYGAMLQGLGRHDEAEAAFTKALDRDPNHQRCLEALAR
jgi:tetratricopeptide (TPR) repeat protein